MNQIRLFAVGTVMIFALTAAAQQSSATSSSATTQNHNSTQSSTDPVKHHLQVLSDKLNLKRRAGGPGETHSAGDARLVGEG